jgi:DNA-damage-inducible protein J
VINNVNHKGFIISANALVTTRINEDIKKEASVVLDAMGLTVSDAVRLLLTKIAREHALPFDPLIPNEETIQAMKDARSGNLSSANSVNEFLDAMNEKD